MIETEVLTEINKIINKLPEACQAIFKLSYIEGFSNQEIADQLQLSINTIKTQKRRGLKYVQSKLNPEFFIIFMSVVLTNLPNT
jgi:RNA polymerase sigma-70 factor (ECF subfamily)